MSQVESTSDKDILHKMLSTRAQLVAAQMFMGQKPEILSVDAKQKRDDAFTACQNAEGAAALAARMLQDDIEHLEYVKQQVDEKKLQRVQLLRQKKEQLIAKINAAKAKMNGVDAEQANELMDANTELEEKIRKTRAQNDELRKLVVQFSD